MSLQLNVSNSLTDLAGQLAAGLRKQGGTVFQKQYMVTQTEGMNNWLSIQLAAKMGIHANTKFLKPNELVNQLYFWMGGDVNGLLGADHLQWLIYNLLDEPGFVKRFTIISAYYRDDELKRISLAKKVADLFDQYQVYRSELLDEWNVATIDMVKNEDPVASGWQKYLWIKVKEKAGAALTDKTSVIYFIIQQLNEPVQQERILARLPHLHIFGVSIITRLHIHLLNELSKYLSVHFYLLNPAPLVYWLDDKTEKQMARLGQLQKMKGEEAEKIEGTGNPLLINWGKVIQETFGLLFENEAFLNMYNDAGVVEPESGANDTLLQKIQNDIFYNHDSVSRNQVLQEDLQDGALTINACFTPVREVEVLYNYLVHLVDQKKELLSPRDIVVMVSDIDAYAPYIKAIFNTAPYQFPFSIADESFQSGDSLFTAIESLLAIAEDSFKAEEVMQLLDSGYIRRRFNITDTLLLRKVVGLANIRFGMEGSIDDDTRLVSWNTGIQRILYGICISGSEEYDAGNDTIYPLDVAEGDEAMELIRFVHFIEVLKWYVKDRANKRTLAEWGNYIHQLTDNMVYQSEINEGEEDYQRLLQHIENLNVLTVTCSEPVSFEVFKHSFLGFMTSETRSHSFATGGITFCSLIPMRSIPFKVVALLGMNFDKFPRRETPVSFNLMEQKRRKGDRNVKDNDKHLFLETILSARQYLYISYLGRSAKDNSILPPSALVDELVDYVESGMHGSSGKVRDILITLQPLHGFSQQYFRQILGLYSYLGGDGVNDEPKNKVSIKKEIRVFEWNEIGVGSLLSFFKNPFKSYYNKVLGIYYGEEEVLLPNTELFELDGLQEWKIKNDLLRIGEDNVEGYRVKALKTGALPLKHMSDIQIAATLEEIASCKKIFQACIGDDLEQELLIDIPLEDTVIAGKLTGVFNDKLMVVSFSKNHYKYLLDAYIRYVLVTAQGIELELNYLPADRNSIFTIPKNTLTKAKALEVLNQLVSHFKKGHEEIFLLYPGLNENPLKLAELDFERFNKKISISLDNAPDEYLQKEYDNGIFESPASIEQFYENTISVFSPVAVFFPVLIPLPKN